MADKEPESSGAVRSFYAAYWMRVRMNLWGEVNEDVVPVLLGRFKHEVTVCPDGIMVVMHRASSDAFAWHESDRPLKELLEEVLSDTEVWERLEVGKLKPSQPSVLDFDLDVARKRDEETEQPWDRVQSRYVSFDRDYGFWTPKNAERLASRNLAGPVE
jgi:hypothetical protein